VHSPHLEDPAAHGAPRLGPSPPRSRPGPHHSRPGAPRRQRRGDADGRGRSGRPLLLQPPREGCLLRRLGARSPCYCCLDPIPPLRGGVKNVPGHMRVQRGVISYSPRSLRACLSGPPSSTVYFSNTPSTLSRPTFKHAQHTHAAPHAALGRHAQYTRAAPSAFPWCQGAEGVCSKSTLPTAHNYQNHYRRRRHHPHHHLFLRLLLEVFIAARVIFKRRNPRAAEDGAEDFFGFRTSQ